MKKKTVRIDSGAPEKGPFPIEKDGLGELLGERAIATATSGDEPAEYNEDDLDDGERDLDDDGTVADEDEDDFDAPDSDDDEPS